MPRLLTFADARHGWLWTSDVPAEGAEAGTLFATSDGGAQWTPVARAGVDPLGGIPASGTKPGLLFTTVRDGWMTATRGTSAAWIYTTQDGGRTWRPEPLPPRLANAPIVSVNPLPTGSGSPAFSVTEEHQGTYSIAVLARHSGSWVMGRLLTSTPGGDMHVSFADRLHGFATDGSSMFRTTDGGLTWNAFSPKRSLKNVTQLDFISPTVGFALLSHIEDGGHDWTALPR